MADPLVVTQTTDFRGGAAETGVDSIIFNTSGPATAVATFAPAQFGPGLISASVHITGDSFGNEVRVDLGGVPDVISAVGWTFENWSSNDAVSFFGTPGSDSITGSSKFDVINCKGGLDHIDSGAGNDFIQTDTALAAGSTIDGGAEDAGGVDRFNLILSGTVDLRSVTFTDVERLGLVVSGLTAIVDGDQIGAGGFTQIEGDASDTVALTVRDNQVDLSGVTFIGWGADDTISIQGSSSVGNTLVGSNQKDIITGTGNSIDNMTGGDGADTLTGANGIDTFHYLNGGDVDAGETINGGGSNDSIKLENAGAINFTSATIIDVEILDFFNGNSTATFDGDSFDSGEIGSVSGSTGVDQLIITTDDQLTDIGAITFTAWTNGTDSITILGSSQVDLLGGCGIL